MAHKLKLAALALASAMTALMLARASASASTVDVSYTVSGSPGDWTYDFTITNNIGGTNDIYAVVIPLPSSDSIIGSPSGWGGVGTFAHLEWCYNGNCGFFGTTNLAPGQTLSGFLVQDTSLSAMTSVQWTVFAEGGTYTGSDNINPNNPGNPGFTGTATTPLPAALPLFATGLGGLGLLGWRRKRKAQAVA